MVSAGNGDRPALRNIEMPEETVVDAQQAVQPEPGHSWPGWPGFAIARGFLSTIGITLCHLPVYGPDRRGIEITE